MFSYLLTGKQPVRDIPNIPVKRYTTDEQPSHLFFDSRLAIEGVTSVTDEQILPDGDFVKTVSARDFLQEPWFVVRTHFELRALFVKYGIESFDKISIGGDTGVTTLNYFFKVVNDLVVDNMSKDELPPIPALYLHEADVEIRSLLVKKVNLGAKAISRQLARRERHLLFK